MGDVTQEERAVRGGAEGIMMGRATGDTLPEAAIGPTSDGADDGRLV